MSKTTYTYFIYYSALLNNGQVSEINAVNDLDFKMESKESIDKVIKLLADEINPQLFLQGTRAHAIILKNFILINEVASALNIVNN